MSRRVVSRPLPVDAPTKAVEEDQFDPPVATFANLYKRWANAEYGLLITGQVQIDSRFLSVPGDVVCHSQSLEEKHMRKWKAWAAISKQNGTPSIVQLAHPGRMSAAGAGMRPSHLRTMCPSSVPVSIGDTWLDKLALNKTFGIPKAMTIDEIDHVVSLFKHGARVSHRAGFDGIQLHGAHGFLLPQFLSPYTNRRTDEYGGSPEKRMKLLRRLVEEIRLEHPPPFIVSVKLNSADYMEDEGLQQDEGIEQVRWLAFCGMIDFIEISGGNAEQKTSGLHNSFNAKTLDKAPKRSSTRIREAFFTEFADKVRAMGSPVPIQMSGGFRSRNGMADAIEAGECDMIGLGRSVVLQPELPKAVLLNELIPDDEAFAMSHQVQGQWLARLIPIKAVGAGLGIQFFYYNMRRLGRGYECKPWIGLPGVVFANFFEALRGSLLTTMTLVLQRFRPY